MTRPRVLVVDDHRDMADGIAMLLGELPLDVEVAYSAKQALSLMEKRETTLVLTDIRMPRMDGVQLLAEVKARSPQTRVVLLTAFGSIDSAVEAMKEGASDYLTKPFDNSALLDVVKRHVAPAAQGELDVEGVVAAVAALLSPDDLFSSLGAALETLRGATGADDCELFLSEPDGKDALLSVWTGPDGEAMSDRMRFEPNVGYPGIVVATGKSLATSDLADDPRFLRRRVTERGIRSYACAPLTEARGALGSIHLLSRSESFPVERAVALLERVAVPVSSAVRAGLATLRQEVDAVCAPHESGSDAQLRALLDTICRRANATYGTIALVDPEKGLPARVVSTGPASLLCARAELGEWADCPTVLDGHGFAADRGRRGWPIPCRRGIPSRVTAPCCLPLRENGRFHGLIAVDLGRRGENYATARLVPLLVMAQQAALHLAPSRPGLRLDPSSVAHPGDEAKAPELELRCLGSFEVLKRGSAISAEQFSRSKALMLLKLLALRAGTPISKDFLIEQLWPDADPQSGANRLHGVMHALRSVIEPHRADRAWLYVRNRGDVYYLNLDAPMEIDLVRYRELARTGMRESGGSAKAIATLEQALELYRGELFQDDPYAEWCEAERRELAELQLRVLERAATLRARSGDLESAVGHLQQALRIGQHREDLLESQLRLLLRMGRAGEARAQFDEFRVALEKDLGVKSSPELEALRQRVFRSSS
ncbi:MAG: response regulator [Polyangiaceae bacterium]|nr:response regulator [Polyangiaceae bacterium]MCE7889727.1 response regulator [Sorangiineae bacterium PRO1]MCL4755610.1 response regulator [Myxococcales bacterium]